MPDQIHIYDLEVDDENTRHMYDRHGVTEEELWEVFDSHEVRIVANEGEHRTRRPYAIIGPTAAGRWLYIPIEATSSAGVWRPATAFDYE